MWGLWVHSCGISGEASASDDSDRLRFVFVFFQGLLVTARVRLRV